MKIIIYIFLIIALFRILFRLFGVQILTSVVKRQARKADPNYNAQQRKEGEINIDYVPPKRTSNLDNSAGEFVDYTEVK